MNSAGNEVAFKTKVRAMLQAQENFTFDLQDYAPVVEEAAKPVKEKKAAPKLAEQKNPVVLEAMESLEMTGGEYEPAFNPTTERAYSGEQGEFLALIAKQLGWPLEYAGFNQWKDVGRKVKKGEKAIQIQMPCFIYGKTYGRVAVKLQKSDYYESGVSVSWQGHSEGGNWHFTDAAAKVMNERHGEMLRAAFPALRKALIEPTKKQWVKDLHAALDAEQERVNQIRDKIRKAGK